MKDSIPLSEVHSRVHGLAYEYMANAQLAPLDYNWSTISQKITQDHQLAAIPYEFEEISRQFISGALFKQGSKILIFYNSAMSIGRQSFTICHEFCHFLFHLDKSNSAQNFFDRQEDQLSYNELEQRQELEANFGASFLMLPDIVIIAYLKSSYSFPTMAENLKMTKAALYVRLVEFLKFNCDLSGEAARKVVNAFRYHGNRANFQLYLSGFGSKIEKQIISDYHLALSVPKDN